MSEEPTQFVKRKKKQRKKVSYFIERLTRSNSMQKIAFKFFLLLSFLTSLILGLLIYFNT